MKNLGLAGGGVAELQRAQFGSCWEDSDMANTQQRYMSSVILAAKHGEISVSAALWGPFGVADLHGSTGEPSAFHTHIPVSHALAAVASNGGYGTSPPKKTARPVCSESFSPYVYCKIALPIKHPLFEKKKA